MADGRLVNDARNGFLIAHGRADRAQPWEERSRGQQALDEHIAAAVAAAMRPARPVPEGEVPVLLERIRRRAEVWAALPDGEAARCGREILAVLAGNPRGDQEGDGRG